uniref:DUF834 domain-containing protein n=1 Tax=Oryza glumipatula TaxID=40148 RepID=A0A0D9Z3L1_9ORYZ
MVGGRIGAMRRVRWWRGSARRDKAYSRRSWRGATVKWSDMSAELGDGGASVSGGAGGERRLKT